MKFKAIFILVLGVSQMVSVLLGESWMVQLSRHTAASPAPDWAEGGNGFERFSSKYFVEFPSRTLVGITPENLSKVPSALDGLKKSSLL